MKLLYLQIVALQVLTTLELSPEAGSIGIAS